MKKNDWHLLTATALFSFLFYEQSAGINFILFNIVLISFLLCKKINLSANRNWWIAVVGCLCSSFCIVLYGNTLSVVANLVSLSILSSLSFNVHSSVFFSLLFSGYSYASAPIAILFDWVERIKKNENPETSKYIKKICLVGIPLLITLLFFFMYRVSNPLFNELAKKINLDFISLNWVFFTLGGFLILYGFFNHRKIKCLSDMDEDASNDLDYNDTTGFKLFGKSYSIHDEIFSGNVLFLLLNALLLIVNGLDFNFLFMNGSLPKGLTYSEFVHQGIGMLIVSILIAIAIILFYFRGSINFYQKNATIKLLVYFWIIQNGYMVICTGLKNDLYINEYGLTYKRIAVYIYLLLVGFGLLTTFVKIIKLKTNNYLFRINGWLFSSLLIVSCFFNWDAIIFSNNLYKARQFDSKYLFTLSDTNLPNLFLLSQDSSEYNKVFNLRNEINHQIYSCDSDQKARFDVQVKRKIFNFLTYRGNQNWKSWNYDDYSVNRKLLELDAFKKVIQ